MPGGSRCTLPESTLLPIAAVPLATVFVIPAAGDAGDQQCQAREHAGAKCDPGLRFPEVRGQGSPVRHRTARRYRFFIVTANRSKKTVSSFGSVVTALTYSGAIAMLSAVIRPPGRTMGNSVFR